MDGQGKTGVDGSAKGMYYNRVASNGRFVLPILTSRMVVGNYYSWGNLYLYPLVTIPSWEDNPAEGLPEEPASGTSLG